MRPYALCLLQGHSCSPAQQFAPLLYITLTIFKQQQHQQHQHQHPATHWQDKVICGKQVHKGGECTAMLPVVQIRVKN